MSIPSCYWPKPHLCCCCCSVCVEDWLVRQYAIDCRFSTPDDNFAYRSVGAFYPCERQFSSSSLPLWLVFCKCRTCSTGSISSSVAGLSLPKASLYEHLPYSNPAYGYGTPSPTLPAARTGLEYQEVPTAYSSSTAFQPSHSSAYLTGLVSATQFDALQEQAYQAGNNLQYHDVSNSAYQNALSSLYESQGSVYQTGQASVFQTGQGSAYQLPQTEYAANGTVPDAGSGASYHQNYARSAGEYMYQLAGYPPARVRHSSAFVLHICVFGRFANVEYLCHLL